MTLDIIDVVAAVVIALVGNGLLGSYLLRRARANHERKLESLKSELEATIRTLQTALDRTVSVHRAHFETEFAALRDIWAKVAAVRATMAMVRPLVDIVPAGESLPQRDERDHQRFVAFDTDVNILVHAVHTQSPFVPREIFQKLEELIQIARGEDVEVQVERGDPERGKIRGWHKRGREHYQQLCDRANELSDLIRARVKQLTIIPGGR